MLQKINENNYKKILPWRNQELVRKNSLDSKIISDLMIINDKTKKAENIFVS